MRLQPRQQLLEIWRATALASFPTPGGSWTFGGRRGRNSISDAEQLLCIMLPAAEIPSFRLDDPDDIDPDVLKALRPLGGPTDIIRVLIRAINEYMIEYSKVDGTPVFSGGSYFVAIREDAPATEEQLQLDVVESYAS